VGYITQIKKQKLNKKVTLVTSAST